MKYGLVLQLIFGTGEVIGYKDGTPRNRVTLNKLYYSDSDVFDKEIPFTIRCRRWGNYWRS